MSEEKTTVQPRQKADHADAPPSGEELIRIEDLCFEYAEKRSRFGALDHIDLTVNKGEFVCILGASGCGKSTLLNVLAGLYKPGSGKVSVNGKKISGPGPDRAVVFQHYSLFPWLTAKGNVLFGLKSGAGKHKYNRKEREVKAMEYLKSVNLEQAADKYPNQLSGGMKQRVAVARALALESDILLMDEPFGAIDPRLRLELQELISALSVEKHKTVIFVTHDIDEAILLADRIVVMEPAKIRSIETISFPHPRKRADLIRNGEYEKLRLRLTSAFYDQLQDSIGGEVVL